MHPPASEACTVVFLLLLLLGIKHMFAYGFGSSPRMFRVDKLLLLDTDGALPHVRQHHSRPALSSEPANRYQSEVQASVEPALPLSLVYTTMQSYRRVVMHTLCVGSFAKMHALPSQSLFKQSEAPCSGPVCESEL